VKARERILFVLVVITTITVIIYLAIEKPILIPSVITPHLAYLIYIWVKEKIEREPLLTVFMVFCYGFISSTFIAIILQMISGVIISSIFTLSYLMYRVVGSLILAPVIEELAKFSGVCLVSRNKKIFNEIDDGIVYGASVGLGFSALETILYSLRGQEINEIIIIALLRVISSTLSHAASSALAGLGLALYMFKRRQSYLPMFLIGAMFLHFVHNFLVFGFPFTLILMIIVDVLVFIKVVSMVK